MSVCWYCYWGWAKPVAEIYQESLKRLDGNSFPLLYGPAHVVWEDENFDLAELCLRTFESQGNGYTDSQLDIVRWSLEQLIKLPPEDRCIEPSDYDGEHPEMYPPTVEVGKAR